MEEDFKTIPFDISRKENIINLTEWVITRTGLPVRIIYWELNNVKAPIVGVVTMYDGSEVANQFSEDGRCMQGEDYDLFIVAAVAKFQIGDIIVSKHNPKIQFKIMGNKLNYVCEFCGEEDEHIKKGDFRVLVCSIANKNFERRCEL